MCLRDTHRQTAHQRSRCDLEALKGHAFHSGGDECDPSMPRATSNAVILRVLRDCRENRVKSRRSFISTQNDVRTADGVIIKLCRLVSASDTGTEAAACFAFAKCRSDQIRCAHRRGRCHAHELKTKKKSDELPSIASRGNISDLRSVSSVCCRWARWKRESGREKRRDCLPAAR